MDKLKAKAVLPQIIANYREWTPMFLVYAPVLSKVSKLPGFHRIYFHHGAQRTQKLLFLFAPIFAFIRGKSLSIIADKYNIANTFYQHDKKY